MGQLHRRGRAGSVFDVGIGTVSIIKRKGRGSSTEVELRFDFPDYVRIRQRDETPLDRRKRPGVG